MLRFLARAVGLLLVSAGFVGLVIDGTRSLANNAVSFTPLRDLSVSLFPKQFATLEPAARQLHPAVWDPVLLSVLQLPASVLGFALGALLLWLGQKPEEPVGYLTDG